MGQMSSVRTCTINKKSQKKRERERERERASLIHKRCVRIHVCIYLHTQTYMPMCTCIYIYIYIYIYICAGFLALHLYLYIYIYIYGTPPPLTYPFASFETQRWVGAGGSVMERRPRKCSRLRPLSVWSSQSPKVLRSLNFFMILKRKRWEAPKDSKDSIFGGLGRLYAKSERLRPLSTLGLWELQNTERLQSFGILDLNKIEASQCFGTLGVPEC